MATKRLGKGLEALIRPYKEIQTETTTGIMEILISKIKPNPSQPRKEGLDTASLAELTASIKERGIITPITVKEVDTGFLLVAGERRWRASRLAGLKKIPAYIVKVTDNAELVELALIENIQREDLNPVDEAEAYEVLNKKFKLSQTAIAKVVGKKRVTISNSLRLLNLPAEIKASLRNGAISAGHGRAILGLKTRAAQQKLWQKIINENLSVRAAENLLKKGLALKPKLKQKKVRKTSPSINALENELITIMGTKVKIHYRGAHGSIVIEYYTDEDFERVMELFRLIKK